MTRVQDFFRKSLLKATFERKLSGVTYTLRQRMGMDVFITWSVDLIVVVYDLMWSSAGYILAVIKLLDNDEFCEFTDCISESQ